MMSSPKKLKRKMMTPVMLRFKQIKTLSVVYA